MPRSSRGKRRTGRSRRSSDSGVRSAVRHLQALHADLLQQQSELESKIAGIAAALAAIGGNGTTLARGNRAAPVRSARSRRRSARSRRTSNREGIVSKGPFRPGSLKDTVMNVLKAAGGRAMAIKDITEKVLDSGFKTRNKTLAKSIGIALTQMPGVSKVGRGMFRAKSI